MFRLTISGLASAAIILSAAVQAQAPSAAQPSVEPQIELKAKKVCKSEPVVGSRFAKKICHTPAEWEAIQQNDRSVAEGYQRAPCRSGAGSASAGIQC